jgi:hypothetical protein
MALIGCSASMSLKCLSLKASCARLYPAATAAARITHPVLRNIDGINARFPHHAFRFMLLATLTHSLIHTSTIDFPTRWKSQWSRMVEGGTRYRFRKRIGLCGILRHDTRKLGGFDGVKVLEFDPRTELLSAGGRGVVTPSELGRARSSGYYWMRRLTRRRCISDAGKPSGVIEGAST